MGRGWSVGGREGVRGWGEEVVKRDEELEMLTQMRGRMREKGLLMRGLRESKVYNSSSGDPQQ